MKTKISSLSCAVLLFVVTGLSAQGLYFKLGGSYAFPAGSQSLMEPYTLTSTNTGNSTVVTNVSESVKGSYGTGIYLNFSGGYKFTPFIGIDLNVGYQLGDEYKGTTAIVTGNGSAEVDVITKSQGIFISPTAMFMTGAGTVRPYLLVGVVTGSIKIEETSEVYFDGRDNPLSGMIVRETEGDLAFGFRGGAGIDINVASKFSIYAEAIFNSISYYPTKNVVTKAVVDGDDILGDYTVRARETIYVDKITELAVDGNVVVDDTKPTEELRKPLPLSNLSFGFGVKYRLSVD